MKNIMIFQHLNAKHLAICECCPITSPPEDPKDESAKQYIPHYYSEKHARDNGWKATKHIKYCPPDKDYVWVCPDCWEK